MKRSAVRDRMGALLRKTMCLVSGLTWLACLAVPAMADCGTSGIKVVGTTEEVGVACEAVAGVGSYFDALGLPVEPRLTIEFSDKVEVSIGDGAHLPVSGCYDPEGQRIQIRRWNANLADAPRPWGLPWDRDAASSVAAHEVVHAALWVLLEGDPHRLAPAWHEFVAYAVQLDLMDDDTRERILREASAEAFATPESVNVIAYGFDPDLFGLRSYLFARERGASFIRRLIEDDVDFDLRGIDVWCH
ncbi:MAG: hypothetical protein IPK28_10305 [Devosia sp.]|nr:hypothetical protein [Devosia sp.]